MKTKLIAALIVGSFVLAGCGGGGSSDSAMDMDEPPPLTEEEERIAELEEQLEAAQEQARLEQAAREREQAARQREQAAREQAEAEQERLEMEAEEATAALNREQAQDALVQLTEDLTTFGGTVSPKYGAQATVEGIGPFPASQGSTDGAWYVTRFTNLDRQRDETLVVYSDVGPSTSELLTEIYDQQFTPDGDTNFVMKTIAASAVGDADASLIAAPSFPRNAAQSDPFTPNVDSDPTMDVADDSEPDTTTDNDGNPSNDYNIVRLSGTFDGAPGQFFCTGDDCTVTHHGGGVYTVDGGSGWTFRASSTARVSVPDESHTHFGWWKNANLEDDTFTFSTFAVGTGAETPDLFSSLAGTYTYRGRAAGQYALYSPIAASSSTGEFTADAMLQATFDAGGDDTISGRITGISDQPDWSLTLNETTINGSGAFTQSIEAVDWTIDGYTNTGGTWGGQFYFDENEGAVPTAAVGTFTGHYGDEGRIIGAFGAHN